MRLFSDVCGKKSGNRVFGKDGNSVINKEKAEAIEKLIEIMCNAGEQINVYLLHELCAANEGHNVLSASGLSCIKCGYKEGF